MGADKAFIQIDGMPLWRRQLRILEQLQPHELFTAGPAHQEWQEMNCIIIPDAEPNSGPLGGIVGALQRCSAPLLLVLAVDLPNMTSRYLRELVDSCAADRGLVPTFGERFEPVAAVYPKHALPLAEDCLASRDLSLQRFAARCLRGGLVDATEITRAHQSLFLNMNKTDDLSLAAADA